MSSIDRRDFLRKTAIAIGATQLGFPILAYSLSCARTDVGHRWRNLSSSAMVPGQSRSYVAVQLWRQARPDCVRFRVPATCARKDPISVTSSVAAWT
jgi:hypothetical protein